MSRKSVLAVVLVGLMAAPPVSAAPLATLTGLATSTAGRPAAGVVLDLVNLDTGRIVTVRTDGAGAFRAQLDPGPYTVSTRHGYTVVRGPRLVQLAAGQVLAADLALAGLREDPPAGADETQEDRRRRRGAAWLGAGTVVAGATAFALLVHTPTSPSR
jgi:hypothetical protein